LEQTFFHELMPKPRLKLPASKVRIETLNLKPKQKFLYLFDYGDEWCFEVEFLKEGTEEEMFSPRIVDSRGKSPEQYPDNEDDLDDDEEEES
jgi:Plasmid pRiA4b ORF-3-like protein